MARLLLTPGTVTGYDWYFPPQASQWAQILASASYAWTSQTGSFTGYPSLEPIVGFWAVMGYAFSFVMSGSEYSKFSLVLMMFAASFGCYLLLIRMGLSRFASLLGGIVYISVPLFFDEMAQTGFSGMASVYALYPLALWFFVKSVDAESKLDAAALAILSAILMVGFYPPFGPYLGFPAFAAYALYRRKGFALGVLALTALLVSLYWLLPFLEEHAYVSPAGSLQIGTFGLLPGLFFFVSYVKIYEVAVVDAPYLSVVVYVMLAVALAALIRKRNLILGAVMLGLIVFAASPLSTSLVQQNTLLLGLFQDKTKLLVPASLAFVMLFAYTCHWLTAAKHPVPKYIATVGVIILVGAYSSPYLLEYSGPSSVIPGTPGVAGVSFPPSYAQAANYVSANGAGYSDVWLPLGQDQIISQGQNDVWEVSDFYAILSGGSLTVLATRSDFPAEFNFSSLFYSTTEPKGFPLAQIAALFNVKYVVERSDVIFGQWGAPSDDVIWDRAFDNFSAVLSAGGFIPVANFTQTSVWLDPYVLPRVVCNCTFSQQNPASYTVHVNSAGPVTLLQSYDPEWSLNGKAAVEVLGYADGWNVTQPGDYVIQFAPQRAMDFGLAVSELAFLGCSVVLLASLSRRLRAGHAPSESG